MRNGLFQVFEEWFEPTCATLIRRDRNHPSIVMWSIGNEIPEQGRPDGGLLARRLTNIVHEEDRTRPTTAGFNNRYRRHQESNSPAHVDIPGFNYKPTKYAQILKDHPNWIIFGSETASAVSSRGVYHLPIEKYQKHPSLQLTSYDVIAPPWAYSPDVEFDAQEKNPNVSGEFVWTGFDYLGEPTPYFNGRGAKTTRTGRRAAPTSASSTSPAFPRIASTSTRATGPRSRWSTSCRTGTGPEWKASRSPSCATPMRKRWSCSSTANRSAARSASPNPWNCRSATTPAPIGKFQSKYRLLWQVPYAPGTLKAVAYQGATTVAATEVKTAGAPARISLVPDRPSIAADGDDLSFITVRVEDKDGNFCPTAGNLVKFTLEGPGKIAGVDNGNPATVEPFQADYRKAFNGLALVIVRGEHGKAGKVKVTAAGEGLRRGEITLTTK